MTSTSTIATYSAFWPLQFLVICLGCWIVYHLYETYENYSVIEGEIAQLTPRAEAALGAKKQLLALVKEIQQLAVRDTAAAQILNDVKIGQPTSGQPEVPAQAK